MKNNIRQVLIIGVLVLGMYSWTVGTVGAAEPMVEDVTIEPEEPTLLSTITFTATITSEDSLEDVRLIVKECSESVCFTPGFNISMDIIDTTTYQAQVTLTHEDAVKIQYYLKIESNGVWYEYDVYEVNLTTEPDDGTSNGDDANGGTGTEETPGFELIPMVVSIFVVLFLYKRRRFKRF